MSARKMTESPKGEAGNRPNLQVPPGSRALQCLSEGQSLSSSWCNKNFGGCREEEVQEEERRRGVQTFSDL